VISLKTLSFGLPFMALSSCLRGYFYGVRKIMIPASQMIFEQGAQLR
jgi:O-antigen/teichoic acid export membrane protein